MGKKKRPGRPKGSGKKKEAENKHEVPGGFWSQIFAILLILLSILILIGLFGVGGEVIVGISGVIKLLLGYAAWIVPFVFFWQSIKILASENNKLPAAVWVCTILFFVIFSGLFQLMAVDPTSRVFEGAGGGVVGWFMDHILMGNASSPQISVPILGLIYAVLLFVLAFFVLAITPRDFFAKISEFFSRESETDRNNRQIAGKLATKDDLDHEVKINGETTGEKPHKLSRKELKLKQKREMEAANAPKSPAPVIINNSDWKLPSVDLLPNKNMKPDAGDVKAIGSRIEQTLAEFGIEGHIAEINIGPRVTQYAVRLQPGIKPSRVAAQEDSLKMKLAVESIRIQAPIPGKQFVGIEVPNKKSAFISLRSLLESPRWHKETSPLEFAVGQDILGKPVTMNLRALPHLLIAGTTGSGKSVMMNTIVTSLLYRNSPNELKIVMIDPKGSEMMQYNEMPHLAAPVVNGTSDDYIKNALNTMRWVTEEMDNRFKILTEKGVANIQDFNEKYPDEALPYLVVVIDEYTDLLDVAKKHNSQAREQLQTAAQRIAQKGRASGVHEVILMQAPRKEYLQGAFKANIPARLCFAVTSKMESNMILNMQGGEKLMGYGDMLYINQIVKEPTRVQAVAIEQDDSRKVVDFLKKQSDAQYNPDALAALSAGENSGNGSVGGGKMNDDMRQAAEVFIGLGKASTSVLSRRLNWGYGRSARVVDELEAAGVIGPQNGSKPREVLVNSIDEVS